MDKNRLSRLLYETNSRKTNYLRGIAYQLCQWNSFFSFLFRTYNVSRFRWFRCWPRLCLVFLKKTQYRSLDFKKHTSRHNKKRVQDLFLIVRNCRWIICIVGDDGSELLFYLQLLFFFILFSFSFSCYCQFLCTSNSTTLLLLLLLLLQLQLLITATASPRSSFGQPTNQRSKIRR